jgi:hypothetical protein
MLFLPRKNVVEYLDRLASLSPEEVSRDKRFWGEQLLLNVFYIGFLAVSVVAHEVGKTWVAIVILALAFTFFAIGLAARVVRDNLTIAVWLVNRKHERPAQPEPANGAGGETDRE